MSEWRFKGGGRIVFSRLTATGEEYVGVNQEPPLYMDEEPTMTTKPGQVLEPTPEQHEALLETLRGYDPERLNLEAAREVFALVAGWVLEAAADECLELAPEWNRTGSEIALSEAAERIRALKP